MPLPVSRGLLHPQFGGQGYLRGRVVLGSSVRNRSGGIEAEESKRKWDGLLGITSVCKQIRRYDCGSGLAGQAICGFGLVMTA